MEFRVATPADAAVLAELNRQLIRDEGHRNRMTIAELEQRMAGWLAGEYRAVLFLDGGRVLGYALFRFDPEYVYLRQVFVCPEDRCRGAGRAAMAWLRGRGAGHSTPPTRSSSGRWPSSSSNTGTATSRATG